MNIVEFKNINVVYESKAALKNIELTIRTNEHYAILGANGSGKTTLMKLFSRDMYPLFKEDCVKKLFGQEDWNIWQLKSKLGIISNDLYLDFCQWQKKQSGFDVVASGFKSSLGNVGGNVGDNTSSERNLTQNLSREQEEKLQRQQAQTKKVLQTMVALEIEHLREKPLARMSTGEIKRCIIGRALVHDPQAILLDEPTSGLDIKARLEFIQTLRKLSTHTTIILITHHIEEIFPEIQKVALLKDGEIFMDDDKEKVLSTENLSTLFQIPLELRKDQRGFYHLRAL